MSRANPRGGEFHPDHESFSRFILTPQAQKPVLQICLLIARDAAASAPVGNRAKAVRFANSFKVRPAVATFGKPASPHAGGHVYNDAPSAVYAEFGTGRQGGHRTLRRAAARYHDPKVDSKR